MASMPERHAAVDDAWRRVRAGAPARDGGEHRTRLTFLGHSSVLIELDELRILTDPMLRDGIGPIRRQVRAVIPELFADLDAVFISHGHHDHLDPASLRAIPGRPTVIVPRGFRREGEKADLGPVEEVEPGDQLIIDRVRFEVVHAEHAGKREPFGPDGPAIGSLLTGSRRVYFPGDTALFPGLADLARDLDVALLPVWGWGPNLRGGHLDPELAAQAAVVLKPRVAIPIHWGTFYPAGLRHVHPWPLREPGQMFADAVARVAPEVDVRVLAPGEWHDLDEA
jgi:L-ascorbate metabolism protein UlaG (beta-lactamase superfamily)